MKKFFGLNKTYSLIRLGRDYDGGYLVEKNAVDKSKFLVGMGLNDDWSFEKDFVALNKVGVHVYDHTVNKYFWKLYYRNIYLALRYKFRNEPLKRLLKYFKYRWFFRNKEHFKECIGKNTSLEKVISRINTFPIFLKIDIEGSEYKILDELLYYSDKISGAVIEFHDVDVHLEKIYEFVSLFELQLVHIHGNNYGGQSLLRYPLVIEMTFAKDPVPTSNDDPILPHPLDRANNPHACELNLDFNS